MLSNVYMNKELDMGDEGVGGFLKKGIVYKCSPNQLTRATTLPWYGMGLSSKFVRFSAGSLCRTPESGLSQVVGNSIAGLPIGFPPGRYLGFSHRGTRTTLDRGRRPGFAGDVYSTR
jgi:hypothetical protein